LGNPKIELRFEEIPLSHVPPLMRNLIIKRLLGYRLFSKIIENNL
jgi:hypothetical protein